MVQVTGVCDGETDSQTGAAIVAIVFLSIFSALILGDAVLSALAIKSAIASGERPLEEKLKHAIELLRTHSADPGTDYDRFCELWDSFSKNQRALSSGSVGRLPRQ
jgi:hypothetical protein